jgi:hypothetical protein
MLWRQRVQDGSTPSGRRKSCSVLGGHLPARDLVDGFAPMINRFFSTASRAGKTLPQVVIATKQTAATLKQLRAEYDEMVGGMVIAAKTVTRLRNMIGQSWEAHTLADAVEHALVTIFKEGQADATERREDREGRERAAGSSKPLPWYAVPLPAAANDESLASGGHDGQPEPATSATPAAKPGTTSPAGYPSTAGRNDLPDTQPNPAREPPRGSLPLTRP